MARRTKASAGNGRKEAPRVRRRHYSPRKKRVILAYAAQHGQAAAADRYRIERSMLYKWQQKFGRFGPAPTPAEMVDTQKIKRMNGNPWASRSPMPPALEARILLSKALAGLRLSYRAGDPIRPGVDPYLTLAFEALSKRAQPEEQDQ